MNESFEDKFEKLRENYIKNLPEKLLEIKSLWQSLNSQFNQDDLILFHRKIHSLHGSAGLYGFDQIGQCTEELEKIINPMLDNPEQLPRKIRIINNLLSQLKIN